MAMNRPLKKAFEEAAKLPDDKQKELAQVLLEEMDMDAKWDEAFARSQDTLERLADEALAEDRAGLTEPLDPDAI